MSLPPPVPRGARVVLFDGVCNVCNAAVNFIIDRDPEGRFHFASLQSSIGERLVRDHGVSAGLDTLVLVEDGRAFTESAAVLRVARRLGGVWPALYALVVVPRPLRDALYRYFARNRYRWFGQRESCRVPTPDIRRRFLGEGA